MSSPGVPHPLPPDPLLASVLGPASQHQEALLQVLDGVLFVLSAVGDAAYVSPTITACLGLTQVPK